MKMFKKVSLSLSPMAGITDLPFRLICKNLGADVVYSEMISVTGLFYGKNQKSLVLAQSTPKEAPLAIQLFGNNPEHFSKATQIISNLSKSSPNSTEAQNLRKPNEVNINFGCPAKKIYKQESGCCLMKKPLLARKIIGNVIKNTDLPVSIKIRTGISNSDAIDFLEKISDLNWEKVIVHGRTYEEGFSGKINFEKIKEIKQKFPEKTIVVNGGIFSPEDAQEVVEKTGIRHLAIARGCLGNPWLFQQIKEYFETGKYQKPSLEEIKAKVLEHAKLVEKYNHSENFLSFRKHLGWYFKNFPEAKNFRKKLFEIKSYQELEKILENN
jgi:tRNA-dihydrouridine synthase B